MTGSWQGRWLEFGKDDGKMDGAAFVTGSRNFGYSAVVGKFFGP